MPSNLNKTIQKIPFAKMIYPVITLFFAIIVLFLFSKTIIFLTGNIDKVFAISNSSSQEGVTRFDLLNYQLIERRFGWTDLSATTTAAQTTINIPIATAASSTKNTDTSLAATEKASLNIRIFNGPEKSENGSALQDSLNQAGFIGTRTDSHQLILKNTIVQFKTTNGKLTKYIDEIKKIVAKKYTAQIGTDLPDSADYDVSILIGKK
jgi:cell fate (sporulation/competence/biofilm development) regulator YlbF (YheA/YmcA/DUF963 family)